MSNTALSPSPATQSTLLPPKEAAKVLDVTAGTLSVWRCTGRYKLPFVKIGAKVRYRYSDLMAFIDQRIQTQTF